MSTSRFRPGRSERGTGTTAPAAKADYRGSCPEPLAGELAELAADVSVLGPHSPPTPSPGDFSPLRRLSRVDDSGDRDAFSSSVDGTSSGLGVSHLGGVVLAEVGGVPVVLAGGVVGSGFVEVAGNSPLAGAPLLGEFEFAGPVLSGAAEVGAAGACGTGTALGVLSAGFPGGTPIGASASGSSAAPPR